MVSRRAVPWLAHVYDLMCADVEPDPAAVAEVARWSRETGLALPAAVHEFYTTIVHIPTVDGQGEPGGEWTLPLCELWREYAPHHHLAPLHDVLAGCQEARVGRDPLPDTPVARSSVPPRCAPLVYFERETLNAYLDCFELSGADDPAVWAYSVDPNGRWGQGWGQDHESFSGWMLDWFVSSYHEDFLPLSFYGPDRDVDEHEFRPVTPHTNGLWACALDESVPYAIIEELSRRYGEPPARPIADTGPDAYRWWLDQGTVTVTTDPPGTDGVSAWWIHGASPQAFGDLVRSVAGIGSLAGTLTNNRFNARHADAQRVLDAVR